MELAKVRDFHADQAMEIAGKEMQHAIEDMFEAFE